MELHWIEENGMEWNRQSDSNFLSNFFETPTTNFKEDLTQKNWIVMQFVFQKTSTTSQLGYSWRQNVP